MDVDGDAHDKEGKSSLPCCSRNSVSRAVHWKQLIKAAEAADQEAIDLSSFTSVLKRQLDYQARLDFIKLMWEMVYADGDMGEIEASVTWRVAELIGIREEDRSAIQARAEEQSRSAPAS
ncbi:TerB family tellurite resistance protein [Brucella abortus]|nr:TerB family tellurite resistance protein [Brucella abortus]